ncbi:chitobiase/beta-hexosaminidase C-terminal domain-containing protein [Geobacter pickeringii]|uniref:chitobiase/beta-hexosaminidase C-terminal domain-containing protein n=1 Tax=Geobacter pickeringii TaxID=345632 RepID=UPI00068B3D25|nr:chitobiase/beta-hexosaminidase C-terminal domain-containing protein [Geobacter pickeringii]
MTVATIPWGIGPAHAGPGGGTYFANTPAGGNSGTALRKFLDSLPGLGPANANNLGQYIPIASKVTPPAGVPNDGDYYEIGVVEYAEKMHSDLPKKTKLRGYVDLNPAFGSISSAHNRAHYLGPLIIAQKDRPVRVKATNLLPTGTAGNLFLPVDTTAMGAGMGPLNANGTQCDPAAPGAMCAMYTQNRTSIHLHGGNSPWISDGTPHQWFTPAAETTPYKTGASFQNVPDMPNPGLGSQTFFWTNQQSGRLMFYHDHSYGMTRLNVYSGMAAGYLITDPYEDDLIAGTNVTGVNPTSAKTIPDLGGVYHYGIPLIIQDKTFVPQNIGVQDAKWTNPAWGSYGDLWFPHVYEPNQDPNAPDGTNPFGRWDYGPWFWPPFIVAPDKSKIPEPSLTPEAFMDTPVVNGTAYPYLTVEPKPYRFRVLNACNDRTLNLSIFYADPNDPSGKEVKMVPAGPSATFPATWPTDGRAGGVPDPALSGPSMVQIGNESGFLPSPVVIPPTPIGYEYNRRNIVVLNVSTHALLLGPAERADVIVDFSQVPPGSTLILYNDGPAPSPGFDPRYDYYTGNADQTTGGGAPSTLRGVGPNTRTVMQFRVAGTPSAPFDMASLQATMPGAFKATHPTPIVPQSTYPPASGGNAPTDLYAKIQDYSFTFTPIGSTTPATIPFQPKAIQELWDPYGRMNATLGVELPFTSNLTQTTIPLGYAEPATEIITDGQPQIWKITHNGVDTHPVHFHMFDVQLINRVGWDGQIRPPDDNELGWKETVRMNPLEDTIVALRPKSQTLPFTPPNSLRPIDPTMPTTALITTTNFANPANPVATTTQNTATDFGFEYVWHCHILGHEENDFMRPVIFRTSQAAPPAPTGLATYLLGQTVPGKTPYVTSYANPYANQVILQWVDGNQPPAVPSTFHVERSSDGGATYATLTTISYLPGYPPIYTDKAVSQNTAYTYRVTAFNSVGSTSSTTAAVTTGTWAPATGVTITPSKPSPHVVGTNALFTGVGTGAPANVTYQYRFWLDSGAGKALVQDYGFGNSWAMPASTPVGTYTITVDVRTSSTPANAAGGYDATASLSYRVIPTPIPPVTVAAPVPGVYSAAPVTVTLTASTNAPPATIFYTTDGTLPTTASPIYTVPLVLNATTTIQYFAVDVNGTAEAVHSDTWYIHVPDMVASAKINNGAAATNSLAVTLALSAFDPVGVASMQFSNDNKVWSAEEPYSTTKQWTLATGSDGSRTVYIRFRDKSLPTGVLYPPITAVITLDTTPPVTAPTPIPGNYSSGPVTVTLTCSDINGAGCDRIYYTTDGTTPTTASSVYTVPVPVTNIPGQATTIKYFAVDLAGNAEAVKSGIWSMHISDMLSSIKINNGSTWTPVTGVTLNLSATDPVGVSTMQFSNDGTTWSAEEPYATTKAWTLDTGEGVKTVYARFKDGSLPTGNLYPPVTSSILLGTKDGLLPGTSSYLASAVRALKIAKGLIAPTPFDLVHGDVAPYSRGGAAPDGKIDLLDVYGILLRMVGLIATF